ncbi:MAG TPA: beta-1,6-N-acetylglucosaminyltransferase [Herpetosiphonaceae bacterium]
MKLLVLIGTDYHLNHLPHFLAHYAGIGVDTFVCGLHGRHREQARAMLAPYAHAIVADYGTERYDEVANSHWVTHFNDFRRAYARPDEWCLFADVDEFHEYPADFFAQLDREINAIRGRWIERLATADGLLLPCSPERAIGRQFPFATREIFCGISEKIMAVRADLDLIDGYHWVTGGSATPVYFPDYLNVHHFRWDALAAIKYQDVRWTRHYNIRDGRVPDLRGVFTVDPPFPHAIGAEPGKLAYLIVAHDQPRHLGRLIRALDDEHSYFFIHVDAKVPSEPFAAAVPQQAKIVFLPNPVAVEWGRLSVVQAILNLVQTAVASGHAFRYYTVLSGSDYPIKHRREIAARLQTSDRQFMRIDRRLPGEQPYRVKCLPDGKYYGDLTAYHGSMYWSLTAGCVHFMLEFLRANPGYLDLHEFVFPPDEIFFHSLVKHSPFAAAITHDFSDGIYPDHTHHGNHFIDWEGRRPRDYLTLDERDFDALLRSDALFARKFDEHTSSSLLDLLDTHIHDARLPALPDRQEARTRTMERTPAVSCICLTYARPEVLEEAIESFLRQDYAGPKELLVLNDYPEQTLVFDHPQVRVINLPRRFRTVGEKMNAAVALASHDLLFVWDDDDIYLPHRLSFSVAHFDSKRGFFKPNQAWVWNNGALDGPTDNFFHVASCWSRQLFDQVRGYAADGSGYDLLFEERLARQFPGAITTYTIKPEQIYYLYRWSGTGSYHMSGFGYGRAGENTGHDQVEVFVQQQASRGQIRHGRIPLQPRWKTDYRQLVASYLATLAEQPALAQ